MTGGISYVIADYLVSESSLRSRYLWFFDRLNKYLKDEDQPPINILPPHSTRHTYSTLMQARGMPTAIVSKILGHKSLEVTSGYTHMDNYKILSDAVNKYAMA